MHGTRRASKRNVYSDCLDAPASAHCPSQTADGEPPFYHEPINFGGSFVAGLLHNMPIDKDGGLALRLPKRFFELDKALAVVWYKN